MPVRIGRVSSREAERATLPIVSTNASAGSVDHGVAAGVGERREVLGAERADVERRGAGDDLDVLLGGAQLERDLVATGARGRRRAVRRAGRTTRALALDLRLERDAQADLHVRGAQLDGAVLGGQLDAGERLDGRAWKRRARRSGAARAARRGGLRASRWNLSEGRSHRGCGYVHDGAEAPEFAGRTHIAHGAVEVCQSRAVGTETAGDRPEGRRSRHRGPWPGVGSTA